MFDVIVVGTDGSPQARHALETAARIADRFHASEIHVVSGYRPIAEAELRRLSHEVPEEFRQILTGDGKGVRIVDEAVSQLRLRRHDATSDDAPDITVIGHPLPESGADAILDVAEQVGGDLIVVGCRGEGAGRRLLHGSVSTKVAHHAPCDVVIVHDDADAA